jgi:hypothetical protein
VGAAEKPDAAAIKEAVDVPLPPFEQSLVAVGSTGDEAVVSKVIFLLCTQLVCCIASKVLCDSVSFCLDGTVQ